MMVVFSRVILALSGTSRPIFQITVSPGKSHEAGLRVLSPAGGSFREGKCVGRWASGREARPTNAVALSGESARLKAERGNVLLPVFWSSLMLLRELVDGSLRTDG